MVCIQANNKTEFNGQPVIQVPPQVPHPWTENKGEYGRRPGDAKPQAADHDIELLLKYAFFRLWLFIGFRVINKEPHDVEHTAKPRNDKYDVQCFYILISHKVVSRKS